MSFQSVSLNLRFPKSFGILTATAFLLLAVPGSALATGYYWDTSDPTGVSATPNDFISASGTWDSGATANFTTDSTGASATTAVTTTSGDTLTFSAGTNGTAGTVTVSGAQSVGSLTIAQPGLVTFNGSGVTVGTGLTLNAGTSATFNNALTTGLVTVNTGATLILTGGGSSTVAGLGGSGANAFIGGGNVQFTGGTFALGGTLGALSKKYNVNMSITGATTAVTATGYVWLGGGGTGSLTINSTNTSAALSITGVNTSVFNIGTQTGGNGTLNLQAGIVSDTSNFGTTIANQGNSIGVMNVSGGTYTTTNAGNGLIVGASSGSATLNISGGTVNTPLLQARVLAGGSSAINVTGGAVYIGSGGITSQPTVLPTITLSGGTVGASANWSSSLAMTLATGSVGVGAGVQNITFQAANATGTAFNITLSGVLSGAGGLTKTGNGILTLSGADTYAGATAVNAGTLALTTGSINFSTSITVAANTTLQLGAGTGNGAFLADNGSLYLFTGALAANKSILNLNFNGTTESIAGLYINGVAQSAGIYDATALTGLGITASGSGSLSVSAIPEPSTYAAILGSVFLAGAAWRRSRFGRCP